MSVITSKVILRGCFIRTLCLQNDYNNHNNYLLASSAVQQTCAKTLIIASSHKIPVPVPILQMRKMRLKNQSPGFALSVRPCCLPLKGHQLLIKILNEVFKIGSKQVVIRIQISGSSALQERRRWWWWVGEGVVLQGSSGGPSNSIIQ